MEKLRVVVADDEDIIREGMCNYIPWEELGYQLVGDAYDGQLLMEMLASTPMDVLITDIQMPKATGLEVIEEINVRKLDITVVLVTGYDEFDYAKRAIHSRIVFDYLVKPIDLSEFTELLRRLHEEICERRRRLQLPLLDQREMAKLHEEEAEVLEEKVQKIMICVSHGEKQDALAAFERFWETLENHQYEENLVRRVCLELAFKLRWALIHRGMSGVRWCFDLGDPLCSIADCPDSKTLRTYLVGLISCFCDAVAPTDFKHISPLVKACADSIRQEYCNAEFSLQALAEKMNVSANYLSTCFKKEMGVGFLRYVNGLRIMKAQELLADVRLRTYEIANMVGIEDQRYFSRLFKEQTGLSPSEYRAML